MNESQTSGLPASTALSTGEQIGEEFRKVDAEANDTRPKIEWVEGRLHEIVDAAEKALIDTEEPIYQRGSTLVRVTRRAAVSARNFRRAAGSIGLVAVDSNCLVDTWTRIAAWSRYDRRLGAARAINAPDRVAFTYLSRLGKWKVRRLWGAIDAPTLRGDGTILQEPGYDAATEILFLPGDIDYPRIADRPTRAVAERALEDLVEAFASFPFQENCDVSVALSALLGALIRRSLPAAPCLGITAPVMGSGKTLLADCISILCSGSSAPVMVHPSTEEEAGKLMLSVLSEGEAVVLIDNIERPIDGAWLCAALTSESYQGRILGRNAMATVPTSCTWILTGNALVISGDLRTRALLCRLDPRCERPEQREFKGDLREDMMGRRAKLVTAGLTVLRAFAVSGESPSKLVSPWGRFEAWSDRVRAALVWLGMKDPCDSLAQLERDDPERNRLTSMLSAWRAAFGANPATVREAIDAALSDPSMRESMEPVCRDRSGQLDAMRLGRWLQKHSDRIIEGLEFQRAGAKQGSALWQVKGKPSKNLGES